MYAVYRPRNRGSQSDNTVPYSSAILVHRIVEVWHCHKRITGSARESYLKDERRTVTRHPLCPLNHHLLLLPCCTVSRDARKHYASPDNAVVFSLHHRKLHLKQRVSICQMHGSYSTHREFECLTNPLQCGPS
jgi:hypothetical protein